jgi:Helicase associated domain
MSCGGSKHTNANAATISEVAAQFSGVTTKQARQIFHELIAEHKAAHPELDQQAAEAWARQNLDRRLDQTPGSLQTTTITGGTGRALQADEMFEALERYVGQHGSNPPQRYVTPGGLRLGKWVARQRDASREGRLSEEYQERLSAAGWVPNARDAEFDFKVHILEQYRNDPNATGSLLSKATEWNDLPVGQWVHDWTRGRTSLTPERVARLQEIGVLSRSFEDWEANVAPRIS